MSIVNMNVFCFPGRAEKPESYDETGNTKMFGMFAKKAQDSDESEGDEGSDYD